MIRGGQAARMTRNSARRRYEGGRPCEERAPVAHYCSLQVPIGELLRAEVRGAKKS